MSHFIIIIILIDVRKKLFWLNKCNSVFPIVSIRIFHFSKEEIDHQNVYKKH